MLAFPRQTCTCFSILVFAYLFFTNHAIALQVVPRPQHCQLAYLSGPSFAAEVAAGMPTGLTIAARVKGVRLFFPKCSLKCRAVRHNEGLCCISHSKLHPSNTMQPPAVLFCNTLQRCSKRKRRIVVSCILHKGVHLHLPLSHCVFAQEESVAKQVQWWLSAANLRCYRTTDVMVRA
jgi:hypothetical protein